MLLGLILLLAHGMRETHRPFDPADLVELAARARHPERLGARLDRALVVLLEEIDVDEPPEHLGHDVSLGIRLPGSGQGDRVVLPRAFEVAPLEGEVAEELVGELLLPAVASPLGDDTRLHEMLLGRGEVPRPRLGDAEHEGRTSVLHLVARPFRHAARFLEGAFRGGEITFLQMHDTEVQRDADPVVGQADLVADLEGAVQEMQRPAPPACILVEEAEIVEDEGLAHRVADPAVGGKRVEEELLRLVLLSLSRVAVGDQELRVRDLTMLVARPEGPVGGEGLAEGPLVPARVIEDDSVPAEQRAAPDLVVFRAVGRGGAQERSRLAQEPALPVAVADLPVEPNEIGVARFGLVDPLERLLVILERDRVVLGRQVHVTELLLGTRRLEPRARSVLVVFVLFVPVRAVWHRSLPEWKTGFRVSRISTSSSRCASPGRRGE